MSFSSCFIFQAAYCVLLWRDGLDERSDPVEKFVSSGSVIQRFLVTRSQSWSLPVSHLPWSPRTHAVGMLQSFSRWEKETLKPKLDNDNTRKPDEVGNTYASPKDTCSPRYFARREAIICSSVMNLTGWAWKTRIKDLKATVWTPANWTGCHLNEACLKLYLDSGQIRCHLSNFLLYSMFQQHSHHVQSMYMYAHR